MNIDDLKDAWKNDEPTGMHLPLSTELLGKSTMAVNRIRKNMKSEFIATLVSYAVILFFMFGRPQISFLFNIASILVFTIFVLNCFYFLRFYIMYKRIGGYELNTRSSISKLTYELELNTEIYKTYNFAVAPLAVLITITLICSNATSSFIQHIFAANSYLSLSTLLIVFLVILISFALTYIGVNYHIRLQFGKYIEHLKHLMNDLESEG